MPPQIVLLRGVNLGPANRLAMSALREALSGAGLEQVRTYLQSGNIVLGSAEPPDALAGLVGALIAERFGLHIQVVARTRDDLAATVARNPLADVATDDRRYQVSFLSAEPPADAVERLRRRAAAGERFEAIGRELYAWHPDGVARSKLAAALAAKGAFGPEIVATARNWRTVATLLEMARAAPACGGAPAHTGVPAGAGPEQR